jgi:type II secretory pathway component GspD/PulD (secretin)
VEIEVVLAEWRSGAAAPEETGGDLSGPTDKIVERVKALEKAGKLAVNKRFRLTTVDNQKAMAQVGAQVPRVTGVTRVGGFGGRRGGGEGFGGEGGTGGLGGGGFASSISYNNVGTLVSVQPRVVGESVVMEIKISSSDVATRPDGPVLGANPAGEPIRADHQNTLTIETIGRIASGNTILLGGIAGNDDRQVVLVSAKVVK